MLPFASVRWMTKVLHLGIDLKQNKPRKNKEGGNSLPPRKRVIDIPADTKQTA
jgi:hypothetical protein